MDTPSSALLPMLGDAELRAIFRDDDRAIWRYHLLSALLHEGRSVRDVAEQEHTTPETLRTLRAQFLETGHLDVLRTRRRGAAGHIKRQTPLAQAVARELAADPQATAAMVWRRVAAGLESTDIAVPRRSVYRLVESIREQVRDEDELWAPALVPDVRNALPLLPYEPPTELGGGDLAAKLLPHEPDVLARGRWLRDLLIESLLELGPPTLDRLPPLESQTLHDAAFRAFDILVGEAWHGRSREDMESALAVAAATYSRAKRQGLEQLAESLVHKAVRKHHNKPQAGPPPAVPLLGRDRDVQYYAGRLQTEGFALIWGVAGSGKTALALTLAHQAQANGDAVVWHECQGSGVEILHGLLESYGVYHDPNLADPQELLSQLRTQLRFGATLVLECFDRVASDATTEMLVALLRTMVATRAMRLIITSRCMPAWAEGEGWSSLNGLMDDAARTLWAYVKGPTLKPADWLALYQRTMGYPRLLEHLAQTIDDTLQDFFQVHIIEPLDAREREALMLLVFARGPLRDVDDEEQITDASYADAFASLRWRDLVTYDMTTASYHLHALLQVHRATLQSMVREPVALQHTLAEQAFAEGRWYDAIVHWIAEHAFERAIEVAATHLHAIVEERLGTALIEQLQELRVEVGHGLRLAQVEALIGECYLELGAYYKATESLRMALDLVGATAEQPRHDLRRWHFLLAEAYQQIGQWRHALTHVQSSVGNERIVGAEIAPEQRMALAMLQHRIWVQAGEIEQANYWLADVKTQLASYDHPLPAALVAYMEGVRAMHRGVFDDAIARLEDARRLLPSGVHHGTLCSVTSSLGLSLAAMGRFDEARDVLEEQLQATLGIGHQNGGLLLTLALVDVLLDAGNVEEAVQLLGQAELLVEPSNGRTMSRLSLMRAAVALQRSTESPLDHLTEALTLCSDPPLPTELVRGYLLLARMSLQQGAIPTAAQHAMRAVRLATSAGLDRARALAQLYLVRDALERHAWTEAATLLDASDLGTDDPYLNGERAVLQAEMLAATGEQDAAQAALRSGAAALRRAPVFVREYAERRWALGDAEGLPVLHMPPEAMPVQSPSLQR